MTETICGQRGVRWSKNLRVSNFYVKEFMKNRNGGLIFTNKTAIRYIFGKITVRFGNAYLKGS